MGGVGDDRGSVDNGGGVVGRGMVGGGGVDGVADGVTSVSSTTGGSNLVESLAVVGLGHGGVAGAEGLGLAQVSHLSVSLK